MLNYETLISSFDDKLTLMQWLKKVEAALGDASLSSIEVTNPTPTTGKIKLIFADGTSVESDEYTLNPAAVDEIYDALVSDSNISVSKTGGKVLISLNSSVHMGALSVTGSVTAGGLTVRGDASIAGDVEIGQGQETLKINGDIDATNIEAQGTIEAPVGSFENLQGEAITGDSIIENMTGYSATAQAVEVLALDYAGVCKNGNKITFAIAGVITPTQEVLNNGGTGIANFYIPAAVGQKLFVAGDIGWDNTLAVIPVEAMTLNGSTFKTAHIRVRKNSNTYINFTFLTGGSGITAGTSYYIRCEVTFLLSDSLI